ncbi:A/G-specific adenine glycosylase [Winogradskyella immobilis]|uniref:Adenine DNA glycosylase n=1 Tax=Winogradskyella immobilis TaxID=2816852 RepID=A0ABS8EIE1_9FLAO|nr:A/G-specific adenine glycosylase [Winogradskyella immobilis]MCC1482969.1 A/G-specific adenine glycosylase [Winogradskyella immobilis]MCG0015064.1 A/G-specific adenine glycosylase [Winogradskyella immobilis]
MNFSKTITYWYSENKRDFPWRKTKNPYFIWLSEIILQQTQVKQGLPYYEAFVSTFPTVFDLAKAPEQDVLKLWQGLGYYSRARNLHFTAKHIVSELNGVFPNTYSDIIKLKGVGDYTASAIASIAFNEPAAVVDGNVYRILSRFFDINTPINSTKGIKEFKVLASTLIDKEAPAIFNQAIMDFGSRQCKPKNPNCNICPLNNSCLALKKNKIQALPVKLKKVKVTQKYFNFLVCIDSNNNVLFEQRVKKGIWQNLYQFPLIETEKSISVDEFHLLKVKTYLLKDIDFDYSLYNKTDKIHKLSHQHLHTKFWIIETKALPKEAIPFSKLKSYPTPVLISNFINEFNF